MISVIIDTCALYASKHPEWPKSGYSDLPYGIRVPILRDQIIPRYLNDPLISEIIVVASDPDWGFPKEVKLIVLPEPGGEAFGPWTIDKRQAGFEASKGKHLIFHHDDHVLGPGCAEIIVNKYLLDPSWGAISSSRWCRNADGSEHTDIDGWSDCPIPSYMTTNGFVIRREIVEQFPWTNIPRERPWDVLYSRYLQNNRVKLIRADDIRFYDVEFGVMP